MIRAGLILLALTVPAHATSFADRAHCWAYPHHERCRPPALPPQSDSIAAPPPRIAPPAPPAAPRVVTPPPAPAVVPPAPVVTPQAVPAPTKPPPVVALPKPAKIIAREKAKPRVKPKLKPKWKPAPRKRVTAMPSWCASIPKGTTMGQIEFAAPMYGVKLTPANRAQARACLASK